MAIQGPGWRRDEWTFAGQSRPFSICYITGAMSDDDPAPGERSKVFVWMIGLVALLAWFAMLWFMVGDML